MNRVALFLAATTLTFTGMAVHYALALERERGLRRPLMPTSLRTPVPGSNARSGSAESMLADLAPATRSPDTVASTGVQAAPSSRSRDPGAIAVAEHRLAQLRDSASREARIVERAEVSREYWNSLGRAVGLSATEQHEMVRQLAERDVARQIRELECEANPACDLQRVRTSPQPELVDFNELLDPARQARFRAYQDSRSERGNLAILQSRLPPDAALSDTEVEALALVLAEERRRFTAESGQERPQGADFRQRLVARAASLLTPAQLSEFKSLQEEQLEGYEQRQKEMEIRRSFRVDPSPVPQF